MRWALNRVALATTSMVALAFLVPLWMLVGQIAPERALADARQQSSAMVAALTVTDDRVELAQAAASTDAGAEGRLALHPPEGPPLGTTRTSEGDVRVVAEGRHATVRTVPGGIAYLQPVAVHGGRIAVIEVFVPQSALERGVHSAWLALGAVALTLVAGSVLVADRLGSRIVAATRHLAAATHRLGRDDLAVRVKPDGPRELAEVGRSFNAMADRMVGLLRAERDLAADLSHRLRTPLTALRLELETCGERPDVERIRRAVGMLSEEVDGIIRTALEPLSERTAERCDLTEVLADRLAFWSVLAEDHGRAWTTLGDSTPLWVPVPRDEAEAAVDALIGNIFHHTPEGTAFRAGVVDSTLVVEDDGPGIDDPDRALQRGASPGGSTGLGLDIVRRLAATSGGTVVVTRGQRGGARIEVHLKSISGTP
ncbi:sensor histidine kinase [Planosporangium mesophilum]|uniref:Signal transduction histidine-protein kinase/phosphatase MprB n=1 Tax=Planosporangium mesophilum TaxID=689768 RepID=A0A8J3TDW5_9ACTN|nr:HAMP domain-containing sensor histidine kinase [Planosporangium mesophilum]NJC82646.1 HAMP domain-containing histidine kinase [Planosporangium mesophilum]GII25013.1 two-component sensor histidine kinase [Planosporangium mesophilum]